MTVMVEDALRAYLLTLGAVTSLTTTIRPDELMQGDVTPGTSAIVIEISEVAPAGLLSARTTLVFATITVHAIAEKKTAARALGEAIKTNLTNPGTGLDFCHVITGLLPFDATWERSDVGYYPRSDGTETGLFSEAAVYSVSYFQTP